LSGLRRHSFLRVWRALWQQRQFAADAARAVWLRRHACGAGDVAGGALSHGRYARGGLLARAKDRCPLADCVWADVRGLRIVLAGPLEPASVALHDHPAAVLAAFWHGL